MKHFKLVLVFLICAIAASCVTNVKYTSTKQSSDDYKIIYSNEAGK